MTSEAEIDAAIAAVKTRRQWDNDMCSTRAKRLIESYEEDPVPVTQFFADAPTDTIRRYIAIIKEILKYSGYSCYTLIRRKLESEDFRRVRFSLTPMTEEQRAAWLV